MFRGTTPTITLQIHNVDFTSIAEVWVILSGPQVTKKWTLSSGRVVLDMDKKTATVTLSQEETLEFNAGKINVQIRCLTTDNVAYASKITAFRLENVLEGGVIA